MSHKRTSSFSIAKQLQVFVIGTLCIVSSFSLGIKTAGDIQTVAPSEAGGIRVSGDINSDNSVTIEDVIQILEIAQGYEDPSPEQLKGDPNADGHLTVEDALRILQDLASR